MNTGEVTNINYTSEDYKLNFANVKDKNVQKYIDDGYVIVRNVLDPETIKQASAHVQWLQEQHPEVDPELLEHWYMRDDPFWVNLVRDKRILDVVEQFIGPNIATFASHYVCKPPRTGKTIHWHQDGSYWPLKPMEVLSVWLAVDESSPENGCMRLVPGSHKEGLKSKGLTPAEFEKHVQQVHKGAAKSLFEVEESKIADICLHPGDISIHHPSIIHGSNANTSSKRRCGLTIRYIPTSTQIVLDSDLDIDKHSKGTCFLIRGHASGNVPNPYRTIPHYVEGKHFKFTPCQ